MPVPVTDTPVPATAPPAAPRAPWLDPVNFATIALFAFLVRYLYMLQARSCPLFDVLIMDGRQYFNWATRIVGGDWIGDQTFYQAPLYPYFLAVVRLAIGDDLWSIRLVQIALGALSCGFLYLAGRAFFSRLVGAAAALMLALYPPAIFFDTLIQKAGLGLLWTTLLLWLIARASRAPGFLNFAFVGITLGLLMLTREETILLAPLLLLWSIIIGARRPCPPSAPRRPLLIRAALPALPYLAGLTLILTPVALRNYLVGGELVLTTSQAGPNFYIGNNPAATGTYAPLRPGRSNTPYERQDAVDLAQLALGRTLTPAEVSRYWFGQSFEFIRTQPAAWLRLMGRKSALLINAYELPDAEDQYFFERYSPLLRALSSIWHFGILIPIAAAGMVLAARHPRSGIWILYALTGTLILGVILFFVFARYRFPLVPIMMLFAAAAICGTGLRPPWRCALPLAAIALVTAAAAAVAANWPIFQRDDQLAAAYSNAGAALADQGDHQRALDLYAESLRLNPDLTDTLVNRALILGRIGEMDEAIALLRHAARQRPNDPRIEYRLGTALAETGNLPLAATHLARAVQLGPADVDARTNYAMVLLQLGEHARAAEHLGHLVRQHPDDLDMRANYAMVLLEMGDLARGSQHLRHIVQQRPDDLMLASILAWLLATSPDPAVADGPYALTLAENLVNQTGRENPDMLNILAAAQARAGRYDDAIATARQAIALALRLGIMDLAQELESALATYQQRKPWLQHPPAR
jgi:tetratricopeptide (TPR) repeat protein